MVLLLLQRVSFLTKVFFISEGSPKKQKTPTSKHSSKHKIEEEEEEDKPHSEFDRLFGGQEKDKPQDDSSSSSDSDKEDKKRHHGHHGHKVKKRRLKNLCTRVRKLDIRVIPRYLKH